MAMVYQWKPGSHVKIDAQAAGEEMEAIRVRNNGRLDTGAVVEAAKDDASPLHDHFEWDDQLAAGAWRNEQAGHLIRCITVTLDKQNGESAPIRAFVSVKRDEDRSYTSVQHAMTDAELRAQVVQAAWAELQAWRQRHAELIEFSKVFAVIETEAPNEARNAMGFESIKAA